MRSSKLLRVFLGLILVGFTTCSSYSEETEKRLIQTNENEAPTWMSSEEIFDLIDNGVNFMDVTSRDYSNTKPVSPKRALPATLRYPSAVRNAMSYVDASRIETYMVNMTNFYNRYYTSQWGLQSANWVLEQARQIILSSGQGGKASANIFTHSFAQPSVVATIWGADPDLMSEVVVLGAHMDSVVSGGINGTVNNRQPGADDNASGSTALLEALRAILESGVVLKRTLEFHWYAAEEVGLRGSQDIAQSYTNFDVNVISMMNYDVVGYYVEGRNEIMLINDYTDPGLTQLLRLAVVEYLNTTWINWRCGYACTDHASWNRLGIPAACPGEPVMSPNMHTIRDTLETVSYTQIAQFSRLAAAYSIEIAEPN